MKKLMMICGMLFSVITFAHAQGGRMMGNPEERATKAKAILLEQNTEMSKAREDAGEDRKAMRTKMTSMMEENNAKINAVLTDDQKKTFATYQEERKAAMKQRMGRRGNN